MISIALLGSDGVWLSPSKEGEAGGRTLLAPSWGEQEQSKVPVVDGKANLKAVTLWMPRGEQSRAALLKSLVTQGKAKAERELRTPLFSSSTQHSLLRAEPENSRSTLSRDSEDISYFVIPP